MFNCRNLDGNGKSSNTHRRMWSSEMWINDISWRYGWQ